MITLHNSGRTSGTEDADKIARALRASLVKSINDNNGAGFAVTSSDIILQNPAIRKSGSQYYLHADTKIRTAKRSGENETAEQAAAALQIILQRGASTAATIASGMQTEFETQTLTDNTHENYVPSLYYSDGEVDHSLQKSMSIPLSITGATYTSQQFQNLLNAAVSRSKTPGVQFQAGNAEALLMKKQASLTRKTKKQIK